MISFKIGALTDKGKKRAQNQDNMNIDIELGCFIVADGMGGHLGGKIASEIAVNTIIANIQQKQQLHPIESLKEAFYKTNQEIYQTSLRNQNLQGMGTTITALFFKENQIIIGHIGDSRCYFIQPHYIWQLTHDHRLVEEKMRANLISRAEMATDPMRNILTRSAGFESYIECTLYTIKIHEKGLYLLCTDGLNLHLSDSEILKSIQESYFHAATPNLQASAALLVQAANNKGGHDNITCVLIQAEDHFDEK